MMTAPTNGSPPAAPPAPTPLRTTLPQPKFPSTDGAPAPTLTPAQVDVQARIDQILGDRNHGYYRRDSAAIAEVQKLFAERFPEPAGAPVDSTVDALGRQPVVAEDQQQLEAPDANGTVSPSDPRPNAVVVPELPEGIVHDRDVLNSYGGEVVAAGLTQQQSQGLLDWYSALAGQIVEDHANDGIDTGRIELLFELKADQLGLTPEQKDDLRVWAETALFLPFDQVEDVEKQLRLKALKERRGGTKPASPPATVASDKNSARVKIDRIFKDRKHPYFDRSHGGHDAAKQEVRRLFQIAHPEEA